MGKHQKLRAVMKFQTNHTSHTFYRCLTFSIFQSCSTVCSWNFHNLQFLFDAMQFAIRLGVEEEKRMKHWTEAILWQLCSQMSVIAVDSDRGSVNVLALKGSLAKSICFKKKRKQFFFERTRDTINLVDYFMWVLPLLFLFDFVYVGNLFRLKADQCWACNEFWISWIASVMSSWRVKMAAMQKTIHNQN